MRSTAAVAGDDLEPVALGAHHRARLRPRSSSVGQRGPVDAARASPARRAATSGHGCRPRTRLWMRTAGSVQAIALSVLASFDGVGDALGGLRRLDRACPRRARRRSSTASAAPSSASVALDLDAGLVRPDRPAADREHRAGVELLHHAHDRDAGLGVAGDHRAMDRRRAAPARQDRGVHVDHAEPRNRQQRVGQEPAVGGDDAEVRLQGRSSGAGTPRRGAAPAAAPGCRARPRLPSSASARCDGPRPFGRSGCDTSDDHVVARARSAPRSVGTANAGVPKKTIRRAGGVTTCRRASASGSRRTIRSRLMPRSRSTKTMPSR